MSLVSFHSLETVSMPPPLSLPAGLVCRVKCVSSESTVFFKSQLIPLHSVLSAGHLQGDTSGMLGRLRQPLGRLDGISLGFNLSVQGWVSRARPGALRWWR